MHPRPTRPRRPRGPSVFVAIVVALLLLAVPVAWTNADTVPGAVTNISVRQGSAPPGSWLTVDMVWKVPEGTRVGDTFALTLPPELQLLDRSAFDLPGTDRTTGEKGVVAQARISGSVVTFTMTSWVVAHMNVAGTAFFAAKLARSEEGIVPLVFTVDGVVFNDQITVKKGPAGDYSQTANKWATWIMTPANGTPAEERMLWAINGPRIADGTPMVFRDEPGPGQAIACESPLMQWGTSNPGGVRTEGSFAPDQWTVNECSAALLEVELRPASRDVGRIPVLLGRSKVTDPNRSEYRNSGSVTIGGGTIPVSTVVAWAGGEGTGEQPSASPTTTVPGREATTTVPGTEATTTVPGTEATTTVPGTEATCTTPAVTVTVPGPTVTVPGQPFPVPGETVTVPGPTVTVTAPPTSIESATSTTPPVTVTVPGPTVTLPGQPFPVPGETVTVTAPPTSVGSATSTTSTSPGGSTSTSVPAGTATTPGPTITQPGQPFPVPGETVTVPGSTVTVTAPQTSVGSAASTTSTSPGGSTSTSVPAGTVTTPGQPSTTATVAAPATTPAATSTRRPVSGGAPETIDTGVAPVSTVDARLVGAGLSVLLATGLALLYASRRHHE